MFCPNCGNQNPDSARFCMQCAYNFAQPTSFKSSPQVSLPRQNVTPQNTKKTVSSLSNLLLLGFFGIFTVVGVIAFLDSQFPQHQQSSTSYNQPTNITYSNTSSPEYSSQPDTSTQGSEPQSYQIVSQAFTLKAGEFRYYKFTIPKSSGSGLVSGNFIASGGADDIYVVIINETGFTNFKSGNDYKAYYTSGKVTTDDIEINLASGTYYIVFSNAYSILTPKAVNADINVEY